MVKFKISKNVIIISAIVVISLAVGAFAMSNQSQEMTMMPEAGSGTSDGPLHWHPTLRIFINGEEQTIPANIGITVGSVIDTDVSSMRMSPTHTHYEDNIIHMEQMKPNSETVTLGYFFKVWNKIFDENCIFEYCTAGGKSVKMFVNGKENSEFGSYEMKDGDNIEIRYE